MTRHYSAYPINKKIVLKVVGKKSFGFMSFTENEFLDFKKSEDDTLKIPESETDKAIKFFKKWS